MLGELTLTRRTHEMRPLLPIGLPVEEDEIKGFSRTLAEIEWLLLSLALIYLVVAGTTLRSMVRARLS